MYLKQFFMISWRYEKKTGQVILAGPHDIFRPLQQSPTALERISWSNFQTVGAIFKDTVSN